MNWILFLQAVEWVALLRKILFRMNLLHLHNEINWIQSSIDYKRNDLHALIGWHYSRDILFDRNWHTKQAVGHDQGTFIVESLAHLLTSSFFSAKKRRNILWLFSDRMCNILRFSLIFIASKFTPFGLAWENEHGSFTYRMKIDSNQLASHVNRHFTFSTNKMITKHFDQMSKSMRKTSNNLAFNRIEDIGAPHVIHIRLVAAKLVKIEHFFGDCFVIGKKKTWITFYYDLSVLNKNNTNWNIFHFALTFSNEIPDQFKANRFSFC